MPNNSKAFKAEISNLPEVLSWVRIQLEQTRLSDQEKKRVELALEEAVVNIIEHSTVEGPFELHILCRFEPDREIAFELSDSGPEFNPLTYVEEPNSKTSLEERKIGGLGLSIMKKYMDALFYRREEKQNIFTLIKTL